MGNKNLHVLIVAEHASARFGGEAALPLHYFRSLRQRNIDARLVVHERTRDELKTYFSDDFERISFVPDTIWHRLVWQLSKPLPPRLAYFTVEFILRLLTQFIQRRLVKQLVRQHGVTVIHQPIPVSPKEPSMIFGMKVPVVIGPMNGGMDYPLAFQHMQNPFVNVALTISRQFADLLNFFIPGKRQAAALLVANPRTRRQLPRGACGQVIELPENGVDLSVWRPQLGQQRSQALDSPVQRSTRFVYVGRLVDWKAVDLLLLAFKRVAGRLPATLDIIGEGSERAALEEQATKLGLTDGPIAASDADSHLKGSVRFIGWLSQTDCAQHMQQSDVLVLPSLLECGGAVVLEAMTMELPVIATNWGGPADYLTPACGILVEPSSQEAFISGLAEAMIRLAESPELRQAMGRAGRKRVLSQFDWNVKTNKILEIYRQVLESVSNPPQTLTEPTLATSRID